MKNYHTEGAVHNDKIITCTNKINYMEKTFVMKLTKLDCTPFFKEMNAISGERNKYKVVQLMLIK